MHLAADLHQMRTQAVVPGDHDVQGLLEYLDIQRACGRRGNRRPELNAYAAAMHMHMHTPCHVAEGHTKSIHMHMHTPCHVAEGHTKNVSAIYSK